MDSPQTTIWGPHLWKILHSSAERIGLPHKKLLNEEERIWKNLLSSLRYSLPCPACKKHYTQYYLTTSIPAFNKETIRNWLFNLHNNVNNHNNKPNTITINQIPNMYSVPFNFTAHFKVIANQMNKALSIGICSREDILRTLNTLKELKIFYDFF
jgi:hypothetical protein